MNQPSKAMKTLLLPCLVLALSLQVQAQNIGINVNGAAPAASALLDIDGSAIAGTKRGLLIPRMTSAERIAIPAPATGLLVYETTTNTFWYFDGTVWVQMMNAAMGWKVTGNAGTNATTNFIGTTDANDWVIKTGGSAATNERMRVLAGGQTVVNNTSIGAFTNDVFSVYANGTTNGTTANISALGLKAVSGYTSGTGIGLFGTTSGNAANSFAIYGNAPSTTGTANPIRGEASSVNGVAIVGIANTSAGAIPTATNARGVIGQVNGTLAGTAVAIGAQGIINATMTTGDARGVQGSSPADNGTGVIGFASSTTLTGFPVGTYGQAAAPNGFGVEGYNSNALGTGVLGEGNNVGGSFLANGSGGAFTGSTTGTFSLATTAANGTGLLGVGNNLAAFGSLLNGAGVAGNGQNFGVYGSAASNANGAAGAPARAGGYFVSGTGGTQVFTYVACYEGGGTPRKVMGNGTVNTVVKNDVDQYVLLSAPEAPENLFQDFGTAQLVNGHAHITLDPTLSRNILVNEAHPLRVFVQLRGDCKGVFVSNETADGFDVTELQGGDSNASFHWTVTANRANQSFPDGTVWPFAEERFAPTLGPQETTIVKASRLDREGRTVRSEAAVGVATAEPAR